MKFSEINRFPIVCPCVFSGEMAFIKFSKRAMIQKESNK